MNFQSLDHLNHVIKGCIKCGLCKSRKQTVFGEGPLNPEFMFIGEGPGRDEDLQGRPFVGKCGQKLDELLTKSGILRSEIYIANIVKCRPPNNRPPSLNEIRQCLPYLKEQIELVKPKILVIMGNTALHSLYTKSYDGISRMRGANLALEINGQSYTMMPTYHPSYLLRDPSKEQDFLEDIQTAKGLLHANRTT